MRARARNLWQSRERGTPSLDVTNARCVRERVQRRIVLRRPTLGRDTDDLGDRTLAVLLDSLLDRLRVLARELPLRCVVRAALRAEHEEAAQPRPHIDRPGVTAGRVRSLALQRNPLRHAARAMTLQVRHLAPPFPCR